MPRRPLPQSIDEVIDRLDGIVRESARIGSRSGYFAALYNRVTMAVRDGVRAGAFDDNARMERLDVIFANRYLEAWDAWQAGEAATAWPSWALSNHDVPRVVGFAEDTPQFGSPWDGGRDRAWFNQPQLPTSARPFERLAVACIHLGADDGSDLLLGLARSALRLCCGGRSDCRFDSRLRACGLDGGLRGLGALRRDERNDPRRGRRLLDLGGLFAGADGAFLARNHPLAGGARGGRRCLPRLRGCGAGSAAWRR